MWTLLRRSTLAYSTWKRRILIVPLSILLVMVARISVWILRLLLLRWRIVRGNSPREDRRHSRVIRGTLLLVLIAQEWKVSLIITSLLMLESRTRIGALEYALRIRRRKLRLIRRLCVRWFDRRRRCRKLERLARTPLER